jgi:catalase
MFGIHGIPFVRKEIMQLITQEMIRGQELRKLLHQLREEKQRSARNELAIRKIMHDMWALMPECIAKPNIVKSEAGTKKHYRELAARMPHCFYIDKEA